MKTQTIKFMTVLMLFTAFESHAGFFDIFNKSPYSHFEENMPVYFPRETNGKCIHFYLVNDEKRDSYVVTNTRDNTDSLEANYCERMFAKSAHDYFNSIDKGIPASKLNNLESVLLPTDEVLNVSWNGARRSLKYKAQLSTNLSSDFSSIEEIILSRDTTSIGRDRIMNIYRKLSPFHESFWQQGKDIFVNRDFLEQSADWDEILDLNIRAKHLWDMIVKNAPVSPNVSSEDYARKAYYQGDGYSKDKLLNNKISKQISNYKKSVRAFLESTQIYDTGGLSLIKNHHPLFVQALFENYANFRKFYESEKFDHNDKNNMEDIFNAMFIFDKKRVMQDFTFIIPTYYQNALSMDANGFKRLLNSLIILNQVSDGCSSLGLWPGSTRFLTDFYKVSSHESYSSNPIGYLFYKLRNNITKQCGSLAPYYSFNFWGGTPLQYWEKGIKKRTNDIVEIFNKLFLKAQ